MGVTDWEAVLTQHNRDSFEKVLGDKGEGTRVLVESDEGVSETLDLVIG